MQRQRLCLKLQSMGVFNPRMHVWKDPTLFHLINVIYAVFVILDRNN